jgi:hypothetical protein
MARKERLKKNSKKKKTEDWRVKMYSFMSSFNLVELSIITACELVIETLNIYVVYTHVWTKLKDFPSLLALTCFYLMNKERITVSKKKKVRMKQKPHLIKPTEWCRLNFPIQKIILLNRTAPPRRMDNADRTRGFVWVAGAGSYSISFIIHVGHSEGPAGAQFTEI